MAEPLEETERRLRELEEKRPGLEERLAQAVRERAQLTPLTEMEARATQDVLAAPALARERFRETPDLATREALVRERVSQEQGLVNLLRELSSERKGKVEDVVGQLVRAFEAEQKGLSAQFERAATKEQLAIQRMAAAKSGGVGITTSQVFGFVQGAAEDYQDCRLTGDPAACEARALSQIPAEARDSAKLAIMASESLISAGQETTTAPAPSETEAGGGGFMGLLRGFLKPFTATGREEARARRTQPTPSLAPNPLAPENFTPEAIQRFLPPR